MIRIEILIKSVTLNHTSNQIIIAESWYKLYRKLSELWHAYLWMLPSSLNKQRNKPTNNSSAPFTDWKSEVWNHPMFSPRPIFSSNGNQDWAAHFTVESCTASTWPDQWSGWKEVWDVSFIDTVAWWQQAESRDRKTTWLPEQRATKPEVISYHDRFSFCLSCTAWLDSKKIHSSRDLCGPLATV